MGIGTRIKLLREEQRLSRKELANSLQLTYHALSKYETDDREPDSETVKKIADFFECTTDYLYGLSDERNIINVQSEKILREMLDPVIYYLSNNKYHLKNIMTSIDQDVSHDEACYIFKKLPLIDQIRLLTLNGFNLIVNESDPNSPRMGIEFPLESIQIKEESEKNIDAFKTEFPNLKVSIEKGSNVPLDHPSLSPKEERDIARDLEKILANMESDEALSFYEGEPLDAESKELLRISLENTMRLAKQMAKKKFTPKKYRKEE